MIEGFADERFDDARRAFEDNFTERGEIGAAAAVFHRGELVVDLRGGTRDGTRQWQPDTLVITYSTTKPLTATCAVLLWDQGVLDLDEPVARYWPEFGQGGKANVTARQVLCHQAGLVALRADLPTDTLFDRGALVEALAKEEPWWDPGTRSGEHALFYGHLIDEIVRRVDGRSVRDLFAEEIARPWNVDFHIGLRPGDLGRSAAVFGAEEHWPRGEMGDEGSLVRRALGNPPGALDGEVVNSERWKLAEVPAINGYGTAVGLARFYQGLLNGGVLDGHRVLSEAAVAEATSIQSSGDDILLERHVDWGLGFQIEGETFGHGGAGGSTAHAARHLDVTLAYVTNKMGEHDRADAFADAVEKAAAS